MGARGNSWDFPSAIVPWEAARKKKHSPTLAGDSERLGEFPNFHNFVLTRM